MDVFVDFVNQIRRIIIFPYDLPMLSKLSANATAAS